MPDRTLLIRHIPEDLHRDFKALCAREGRRGVTMGWKVQELMKYYTDGLIEFDKAIQEAKEKGE